MRWHHNILAIFTSVQTTPDKTIISNLLTASLPCMFPTYLTIGSSRLLWKDLIKKITWVSVVKVLTKKVTKMVLLRGNKICAKCFKCSIMSQRLHHDDADDKDDESPFEHCRWVWYRRVVFLALSFQWNRPEIWDMYNEHVGRCWKSGNLIITSDLSTIHMWQLFLGL